MSREALPSLLMGQITRPRPAPVKWLTTLLLVLVGTSVVQLIAVWLQNSHLAANLGAAQEAAGSVGHPDLERALWSLDEFGSFAVQLALLGLVSALAAWMVYGARRWAKWVSVTLSVLIVGGQSMLITGNAALSYIDAGQELEREMLVNSLIQYPFFIALILVGQAAGIILGAVCFALSLHPDTVEFLNIRTEPARDEEWERAMAVRRAAVEVDRG